MARNTTGSKEDYIESPATPSSYLKKYQDTDGRWKRSTKRSLGWKKGPPKVKAKKERTRLL